MEDFDVMPSNDLEDEIWIHNHIHGKGHLNENYEVEDEGMLPWGRPSTDDEDVWLMLNVPGYPRNEKKIEAALAAKRSARKEFLQSMEGVSGWKCPKEMAESCGYQEPRPAPKTMREYNERVSKELGYE